MNSLWKRSSIKLQKEAKKCGSIIFCQRLSNKSSGCQLLKESRVSESHMPCIIIFSHVKKKSQQEYQIHFNLFQLHRITVILLLAIVVMTMIGCPYVNIGRIFAFLCKKCNKNFGEAASIQILITKIMIIIETLPTVIEYEQFSIQLSPHIRDPTIEGQASKSI